MQDKNGSDSAYLVPGTIPTSQTLTRHYCMDAGCIPSVRIFRWPGSVFGARCPALGVDPVPGPGCRVPGRDRAIGQ
jgi:hypothetical protein